METQKTSTYQDLVKKYESIMFLDKSLHNTESLWNLLESSSLTFVNQSKAIFDLKDGCLRVSRPIVIIKRVPLSEDIEVSRLGSSVPRIVNFKSFMKDAFLESMDSELSSDCMRVVNPYPISLDTHEVLKKEGIISSYNEGTSFLSNGFMVISPSSEFRVISPSSGDVRRTITKTLDDWDL